MDFKKAIKLFSKYRLDAKRSLQTISRDEREICNFEFFTNKANVEEITMEDVINYMMRGIKKLGWSHNGCQPKTTALRQFFRFLETQSFGKTLNPNLIPSPRRKHEIINIANEKDYQKLLGVISKDANNQSDIRNRVIINLLWDTGAKNSELLSLNIDDLNLDKRTARVATAKTRGAQRFKYIFWSEETNTNLKHWLEAREKLTHKTEFADPNILFVSIKNNVGQRFTVSGAGKMLKHYSRKAKLPYCLNGRAFLHHKKQEIMKQEIGDQKSDYFQPRHMESACGYNRTLKNNNADLALINNL